VRNVTVRRCRGEGIALNNANASLLQSVSIARTPVNFRVGRSRDVVLSNFDTAKFLAAGVLFEGSSSPIVLEWSGGFMETSVEEPIAGCPFIHITSPREEDTITISGVWMNGHATDEFFDTVGVKVENPLYFDGFTMRGVVMNDLTAAGEWVNFSPGVSDDVGFNDLSEVSLTEGTPNFPRQLGIFTKQSYRFEYLTASAKSLTVSGTTTEFAALGGAPIELEEFSMLVTTAFSSAADGTMRLSYPGATAHWGTVTLTNGLAANTLVDLLSQLTRTKSITAGVEVFTMAANTPLTVTGAARFRLRGIVY
jgi:hypothetical protein